MLHVRIALMTSICRKYKWSNGMKPTQFIQQSNEASERRKMNSSEHNNCINKVDTERMHCTQMTGLVQSFSCWFFFGSLTQCSFVHLCKFDLHIGNNQLKEQRHIWYVHQSRSLNVANISSQIVSDCMCGLFLIFKYELVAFFD